MSHTEHVSAWKNRQDMFSYTAHLSTHKQIKVCKQLPLKHTNTNCTEDKTINTNTQYTEVFYMKDFN